MVNNIYASEVMSHPVVTLKSVENVGHVVELLKLTSYNGFPVVDPPLSDQVTLFRAGVNRFSPKRCFLERSDHLRTHTRIDPAIATNCDIKTEAVQRNQ